METQQEKVWLIDVDMVAVWKQPQQPRTDWQLTGEFASTRSGHRI